jgi:hypothetical protein
MQAAIDWKKWSVLFSRVDVEKSLAKVTKLSDAIEFLRKLKAPEADGLAFFGEADAAQIVVSPNSFRQFLRFLPIVSLFDYTIHVELGLIVLTQFKDGQRLTITFEPDVISYSIARRHGSKYELEFEGRSTIVSDSDLKNIERILL